MVLWPNLKHPPPPGMCLEGPRKPTEDVSQDNRRPGRDSNPEPSEMYEALLYEPA
jgi:hypothetical protein